MTPPEQRAEALRLYLEQATTLDGLAATVAAAEAEAKRQAQLATQAAQQAAQARQAHTQALADLRAVVAMAAEAGLTDPDPLRLVSKHAPQAPAAPTQAEAVREQEHRTSPGYSKLATYRALGTKPAPIAAVAAKAQVREAAAGGALVDLWHMGLARRERDGLHSLYALADPAHLPVEAADLAAWGTLRRTPEGRAQVDALVATLRAGAGAKAEARAVRPAPRQAKPAPVPARPRLVPDPEAPVHPAIAAPAAPQPVVQVDRLGDVGLVSAWGPGDHVRVYDPEKHHYRPGTVVRVVTRGNRRGDLVVRLAGADREVQAPPGKVKPVEATA